MLIFWSKQWWDVSRRVLRVSSVVSSLICNLLVVWLVLCALAESLELLSMMRLVLVSSWIKHVVATSRLTVSLVVAISWVLTLLHHGLPASVERVRIVVVAHDSCAHVLVRHVVAPAISSSITHHLKLWVLVLIIESIASSGWTASDLIPVKVILILISEFCSHLIRMQLAILFVSCFRHWRISVIFQRTAFIGDTLYVMKLIIAARSPIPWSWFGSTSFFWDPVLIWISLLGTSWSRKVVHLAFLEFLFLTFNEIEDWFKCSSFQFFDSSSRNSLLPSPKLFHINASWWWSWLCRQFYWYSI